MTRLEQALRRIEASDGQCAEWPGCKTREGYGHVRVEGATQQAHRVIYTLLVGPIPAGLTIDHICYWPVCVQPAHLRPMTRGENSALQRRAFKTHCDNGHEFTPENTYIRPNRTRDCRACIRERVRRYKERKRRVA